MIEEKHCPRCKIWLPITDFKETRFGGRQAMCMKCTKIAGTKSKKRRFKRCKEKVVTWIGSAAKAKNTKMVRAKMEKRRMEINLKVKLGGFKVCEKCFGKKTFRTKSGRKYKCYKCNSMGLIQILQPPAGILTQKTLKEIIQAGLNK